MSLYQKKKRMVQFSASARICIPNIFGNKSKDSLRGRVIHCVKCVNATTIGDHGLWVSMIKVERFIDGKGYSSL